MALRFHPQSRAFSLTTSIYCFLRPWFPTGLGWRRCCYKDETRLIPGLPQFAKIREGSVRVCQVGGGNRLFREMFLVGDQKPEVQPESGAEMQIWESWLLLWEELVRRRAREGVERSWEAEDGLGERLNLLLLAFMYCSARLFLSLV